MSAVPLLASLFLAAVFAVAAVAKLRDRAGARRAAADFGVPARFGAPFAATLPVVELTVAVALVLPATAVAGALAAAVLLLAFTAAVGLTLARGRTPDCRCFGQIAAGPIGPKTLVRNAVLALIALLAAARGGDLGVGPAVIDPALAIGVGVVAVVALQGWLLLSVVAQNGRLLARFEALEKRLSASVPALAQSARGLPVGTAAPTFTASGLNGETMTLEALRAGDTPALLLFADPQCGPCNALLPDVGRWQRDHASRLTIALVTRGTADANRTKVREHGLRSVLLQQDREIAASYQVSGTPSAVLVRSDGTVGSALAEGAEAIAALVSQSVGVPVAARAAQDNCDNGAGMVAGIAKLGEPAPRVRLPDLSGAVRDLAKMTGPTLVLFWNPACSFCQQMLPSLLEWERDRPPGAPGLLVVSTGSVDANKADGLRSTIVLDQDFATGRAFGVNGTPSAVLVDERRTIASLVAVGAPAVMSLAAPKVAEQ